MVTTLGKTVLTEGQQLLYGWVLLLALNSSRLWTSKFKACKKTKVRREKKPLIWLLVFIYPFNSANLGRSTTRSHRTNITNHQFGFRFIYLKNPDTSLNTRHNMQMENGGHYSHQPCYDKKRGHECTECTNDALFNKPRPVWREQMKGRVWDMTDLNHNVDSTGEADESWVSAEFGFREIHLWVLSHEPADTQESQTWQHVTKARASQTFMSYYISNSFLNTESFHHHTPHHKGSQTSCGTKETTNFNFCVNPSVV